MPESPRTDQSRRIQTLSALAACLALSACRVPAPVYVVSQPPEALTVPGPPPPSVIEVPPASPGEGYVWQEGYWNWEDDSYQWVEGDWVEDRPGLALVDASYLVIDGIWTYQPPYWSPRRSLASAGIAEGPGPMHRRARRERGEQRIEAPSEHPPHRIRAEAPPAQRLPPHVIRTEAPPAAKQTPGQVTVEASPVVEPIPRTIRPGIPPRRSDVVLQVDEDDPSSSRCGGRCGDNFKKHPSYRGTVNGRPIFGDDPTSTKPRPGYRLDHTGAIILSSGRRTRRQLPRSGSLEVVRRDPSRRFEHRESQGGSPPRTTVIRPDPRPRPVESPRFNSSHGHRTRGTAARIQSGDISRSRSAMRQISRTPPSARHEQRTRSPRAARSATVHSPRAVHQPAVQRTQPAPAPRRVISQRPSSRSTATPSRPRGHTSSAGLSTKRRRHR